MPATKRKPLVAVLDWKTAPASNCGVDLEAKVLGKGVRTKYYLIDTEADFTPEILGADALIVWQNTLITEHTLDRLKRCRALIRNTARTMSRDGVRTPTRCPISHMAPSMGSSSIGLPTSRS